MKISKCCSRKCLWHITKKDREEKRIKAIKGKKSHNNNQVEKICIYCGEKFLCSPSRVKSKFYCSKKCYSKHSKSNIPKKRYKRNTTNGKRVLEHRYIMECFIGRKLKKIVVI